MGPEAIKKRLILGGFIGEYGKYCDWFVNPQNDHCYAEISGVRLWYNRILIWDDPVLSFEYDEQIICELDRRHIEDFWIIRRANHKNDYLIIKYAPLERNILPARPDDILKYFEG